MKPYHCLKTLHFGLVLALCAALGAGLSAQVRNRTPGIGSNANDLGVLFSPTYWYASLTGIDSGEADFKDHVCSGGIPVLAGQRYAYTPITVPDIPDDQNPGPGNCTVESFRQICSSDSLFTLGVLFATATHGGTNWLAVENYVDSPVGQAARNAAYDAYLSGGFSFTELTKDSRLGWGYWIAITDSFISNRYAAGPSLVVLSACQTHPGLTSEFVSAGARAAIGFTDSVSSPAPRLKTLFERLDGKAASNPIDFRPVRAAIAGIEATDAAGNLDTTLAPAIRYWVPQCPMYRDRYLIFKFDTEMDEAFLPDVTATDPIMFVTTWIDKVTLKATCTDPQTPVPASYNYSVTLHWQHAKSCANASFLDGNTVPSGPGGSAGPNAVGPAWDNYVNDDNCDCGSPSSGRTFAVSTTRGGDDLPDNDRPMGEVLVSCEGPLGEVVGSVAADLSLFRDMPSTHSAGVIAHSVNTSDSNRTQAGTYLCRAALQGNNAVCTIKGLNGVGVTGVTVFETAKLASVQIRLVGVAPCGIIIPPGLAGPEQVSEAGESQVCSGVVQLVGLASGVDADGNAASVTIGTGADSVTVFTTAASSISELVDEICSELVAAGIAAQEQSSDTIRIDMECGDLGTLRFGSTDKSLHICGRVELP